MSTIRMLVVRVGVAIAVTAGARGQERLAVTTPPLGVTLDFDRDDFVLGEPVVGYLWVKNTTAAARTVPAHLEPEYGRCRFDVARGAAASQIFAPWLEKDNDRVRVLAPGEQFATVIKLFYGADGWTFGRDGTYTVVAKCLGVVAEAKTITIVNPASATDRTAADIALSERQVGLFVMLGGADNLGKAKEALQRIVNTQPQSILAGYANLSLGLNAAKRFVDAKSGGVREADPTAAAKYLEASKAAMESRQIQFYGIRNKLALEDSYRTLGRLEDLSRLNSSALSRMQVRARSAIRDAVKAE